MKKTIALLALALSGCTSIHFDNGADLTQDTTPIEQWHHGWALDLYEGSEPVNIQQECHGQEWTTVKTELTFLNGFSSTVANLLAPIWYPKTVTISCQKLDASSP
ncbi:MAG: hypothetical protein HRU20_01140 [Pseudomonadales bacterium]|nr:hypothetical protein [Pseudomonadales bacterium]